MYYYDDEGNRVFEIWAFEHTFFRSLLAMVTWPIVQNRRIPALVYYGFVDDFPDITLIRPGGKMLPGITASETPRPRPDRGQLKLYSDPEVRRTLPHGHLPLPNFRTYF